MSCDGVRQGQNWRGVCLGKDQGLVVQKPINVNPRLKVNQ